MRVDHPYHIIDDELVCVISITIAALLYYQNRVGTTYNIVTCNCHQLVRA